MLEKDVEAKLRRGVKALGCLCLKFVSPGYVGVPDRVILIPGGRLIFVELKKPGERERPRQGYVQKVFRRYGLEVYDAVDSPEKVQAVIDRCKELIGGDAE